MFASFVGEQTTRRIFVVPVRANLTGDSGLDLSDLVESLFRIKANLALEAKLKELTKQGSENLVSLLTTMKESVAPKELEQLHEVIAADKELLALTEDAWLEKLNIENPILLFSAEADTIDGTIGQLLLASMALDFGSAAFAQFKGVITASTNLDFLVAFENAFGVSFEEWLKSSAIPDLLKALTAK